MNKPVPALQAWRWGTSCVKLRLLHGNGRDTTQQNMCSYGDGKSLLAGRALLKRTRTAPSGAIAWLLLILFESRSVKKLVLQYYFKPQEDNSTYTRKSQPCNLPVPRRHRTTCRITACHMKPRKALATCTQQLPGLRQDNADSTLITIHEKQICLFAEELHT